MLKLEIYNLRQIQNFLSLLDQFEQENIVHIKFMREQLKKYIKKETKKYEIRKKEQTVSNPICPSCKKGRMELLFIDGEKIEICRHCRYSKYIGGKDVK
jgi:ribosomal protein L37AE/L43A